MKKIPEDNTEKISSKLPASGFWGNCVDFLCPLICKKKITFKNENEENLFLIFCSLGPNVLFY